MLLQPIPFRLSPHTAPIYILIGGLPGLYRTLFFKQKLRLTCRLSCGARDYDLSEVDRSAPRQLQPVVRFRPRFLPLPCRRCRRGSTFSRFSQLCFQPSGLWNGHEDLPHGKNDHHQESEAHKETTHKLLSGIFVLDFSSSRLRLSLYVFREPNVPAKLRALKRSPGSRQLQPVVMPRSLLLN